jgi:hypothetical protein
MTLADAIKAFSVRDFHSEASPLGASFSERSIIKSSNFFCSSTEDSPLNTFLIKLESPAMADFITSLTDFLGAKLPAKAAPQIQSSKAKVTKVRIFHLSGGIDLKSQTAI